MGIRVRAGGWLDGTVHGEGVNREEKGLSYESQRWEEEDEEAKL